MPEQLIAVYDHLLELYQVRSEAERRNDRPALDSVDSEIREFERAAANLRGTCAATLH